MPPAHTNRTRLQYTTEPILTEWQQRVTSASTLDNLPAIKQSRVLLRIRCSLLSVEG